MNTPVVSIIVPVYNVEAYLRQCLDSLINQTLQDIEIICVDDGSTDGSPAILQEYAARDERIRIITQKNADVSAARNAGMKVMRAPYVMFCDSDDWYELNMCEVMYHALDDVDEASMAVCGVRSEYDYDVSQQRILADQRWFHMRYSGLTELSGKELDHNFGSIWNKIFRRTFLEDHNVQFPEGLKFEDVYVANVCAAHASHIVFVQDELYHYRKRQNSCMDDVFNYKAFVAIDRLRVAMMLWDYYKKHGLLKKWGAYLTKVWLFSFRRSLQCERTKKARRLIADMAHLFIKENDKYAHVLSYAQRREIIKQTNKATSNPAILAVKHRVKKIMINMIPVAAWRRRLRKKYL